MMKLIRTTLLICAAWTICATQAQANSFTIGGPADPTCATCQGSTYTLDIIGLAPLELVNDGSPDTYRVALTIDTAKYSGGGVRIDEVAIKISSSVDQAKLVDGPGGAAAWQLMGGGISSGGCSGSGSGFECADLKVVSLGGATLPGPTLTWVFDIDISGPLFTFMNPDPNAVPSIKARYVDATDNKVGALVSEKVPEPATLALLGLGMSVAAIRRRRAQR